MNVKNIYFTIIMAAAVCLFVPAAFAQSTATLSVGSATVDCTGTAYIDITATDNTSSGIAGAVFTLEYDTSKLSVTVTSNFFGLWTSYGNPPPEFTTDDGLDGQGKVNGYDSPLVTNKDDSIGTNGGMRIAAAWPEEKSLAGGEVIFTLNVKLNSCANYGIYPISIAATTIDTETYDLLIGADPNEDPASTAAYPVRLMATDTGNYNTPGSVEFTTTDTDGDGMDDTWENNYFGNLTHDGTADTDEDGYSDLDEYENGTDPTVYTDNKTLPGYDPATDTGGDLATGALMVIWDGDLVADAGSKGIWQNSGSGWTKLWGATDVEDMIVWGTNLVTDRGAGGVWQNSGSGWTKLWGATDVEGMIVWGTKIVVDRGAGGVWQNSGSGWTKVWGATDVEDMIVWGTKIVVDRGAGGVWQNSGSGWTKLWGATDIEDMIIWGTNLVTDRGAGGVWQNSGSGWTKLWGATDVEDMIVWGANLVADRGAGGLWQNSGSGWTKLWGATDVEDMIIWSAKAVAERGAGGVWQNSGSGWTKLWGATDVEDMIVWGSSLVTDRGTAGLWENYGSGWSKLWGASPYNEN